ncbi:glycoside hydrolase family 71/99-like protein [Anaerophaga thermohalophila]|uniref:glycoside hydrolase family 71/99-like protein n=1 Tax=Anaerophaga thermohalophila TaxID=177400 RepID=UPI000237B8B6|nr:glycoside hydrolase family 71/99-like protein [Anaerophaga thermohalophila]
MKIYPVLVFIAAFGVCISGCKDEEKQNSEEDFEVHVLNPVDVKKNNETHIFVHFMPWYETPESSENGEWGMHWSMATKDPDQFDGEGLPDIASHFNPLIGPYASGDEDVIECQLLLMKYSGIDGLLIDWYGTYDVNDYYSIKENTEALIHKVGEVGIEFAVVYEDRTVSEVVDKGAENDRLSVVKKDMAFLENSYFGMEEYIHIDGKPLLLVFGPINLVSENDWTNAFLNLSVKPMFLTLWNHSEAAGKNADGEYAWVYKDNSFLENFYTNRLPLLNFAMGSAYPGFVDFYEEGGWGESLGWEIPHNDGATLEETLQLTKESGVKYLQIVTWNDYGEGTIIEPTHEFGFSYLETIKQFAGVENSEDVFDQIILLYEFRKRYKNNEEIQRKLDQVFYYFVSMQPGLAKELLSEI